MLQSTAALSCPALQLILPGIHPSHNLFQPDNNEYIDGCY